MCSKYKACLRQKKGLKGVYGKYGRNPIYAIEIYYRKKEAYITQSEIFENSAKKKEFGIDAVYLAML